MKNKTIKTGYFYRFRNHKRISKKGQITYFIIAGVVIVIIVALVIFMRSSVVKKETEEEVERSKEQAFSTQQVENYVTDCLRRTAENALELLGRQGGVIYTMDDGQVAPPDPADEGIVFITHGTCSDISSNSHCLVWNSIELTNPPINAPHRNLPRLYRFPPAGGGPIYRAMDESIRKYIENPASTFFDGCFINRGIPDLRTHGFEIDYAGSQRKIDVTITENDVVVNMNYPLKVTDKATGKIEEIENFKANLNVRLNKIWDFVSGQINAEFTNPANTIDGQSSDGITAALGLEETAPSGKKTQLIEVTDTKSKLKGDPYKFVFGIANRYPVFTFIASQTIAEGSPLTFAVSADDSDEGDTASSTLDSIIPSLFIGTPPEPTLTGNTFTWTPGFGDAGTYIITFSATDGDLTKNMDVEIIVTNVNRPPTANDDPTPSVDEEDSVDISLTGSDLDANPLTYTVETSPNDGKLTEGTIASPGVRIISYPHTLTPAGSNQIYYEPNLNHEGTDSFTFNVNDGSVDSADATVDITINPINDDPVADAGPDQTGATAVNVGDTVTLDGSNSDDVEGTITYSWIYLIGTAVTLTGDTTDTATFTASTAETLTFKLTVEDNDGVTNIDTVIIEVQP